MKLYTRDAHTSAWAERKARVDSINVIDSVNERSIAELTLLDPAGTLMFQRGMGVRVRPGGATAQAVTFDDAAVTYDGASVQWHGGDAQAVTFDGSPVLFDDQSVVWGALHDAFFQGFVDSSTETRVGHGGMRQHFLECVDLHYLADKRVAARAYVDEKAGDIIRDLIAEYLAPEGISEGVIEDGPRFRSLTVNYKTVTDAVRDVAERAGFWWRIRPSGELDFRAFDTSSPPSLDVATAALAGTVDVVRQQPGYRTRQWIRGARARSVPQTEVQWGDGDARAFVTGFPVATEPTIEVSRNGGPWEAQTVGVAGIQEDRDWTYTYGSASIRQHPTGTVLASPDRVRITYEGLFDVIARVDDEHEQANAAAREGGTGIIEHVLHDRASVTTLDSAFQLAGELLAYWARPAFTLRFATRAPGFTPGDVFAVTFAEAGIEGELAIVKEVETYTQRRDHRAIVTLAAGPLDGSWVQWLANLSRRIDRHAEQPPGEVDVVTTFEAFSKVWTEAETPNIFRQTRAGTAVASASTTPEFEPGHRVQYLAWFAGGAEVGRKAFTFQAGADTSEVVTTTVLAPQDAVGSIDEFAWFGGWQASDELGSGVELDRQGFLYTKTDIEQIQVQKTDTKWE